MRIGAVGFLNAEPLVAGLPGPVDRCAPAAMDAQRLGTWDLVLAPVVVALSQPSWQILWEAPAIGCQGAVGSVRLECRPGRTIETAEVIRLSSTSQTSNRLLQLLCAHYWPGPCRTFVTAAEQAADATLVIGDDALTRPAHGTTYDLGGAWLRWTGLPFTFACWMVRGDPAPDFAAQLCALRDRNLADPNFLARTTNNRPDLLHHFTHQLCYDFGPDQHRGLQHFFEKLARDEH